MSTNPADEVAARKRAEREKNPIHIEQLDASVLAALPKDVKILSIKQSGESAWCESFRIDTNLQDGSERQYFVKIKTGKLGKRMMQGTYESELLYHSYCPEHVPTPIAWGAYKDHPDTWFYICDFHDMAMEKLDPSAFVDIITGVHKASMGKSPLGKYGFHIPTHLAHEDSWEIWYTKAMQTMYDLEKSKYGIDEELEVIFEALRSKVIPRLLRPLETGGRSIEPCLLHSDLWPGNCMLEKKTGKIIIFDSCAFWGHNECDLGSWRAPRYNMGEEFFTCYKDIVKPSQTEEDWDDRNRLYAIRYDLLVSALYPEKPEFHDRAKDEMRILVKKFPGGFEDWEARHASS
ncbi:hypothetical protein J4E90_001205 [Alternaria incomplexa]|uniref:uncharacterized protein n=1 Tax=Alternaria incomplexa TaxID=1187928 RepID=UPI002220E276|nr:uncharacterized protein J4E90_001205 [Alternaria incomplexa]KAI4922771.1 hypothetical protein J4E90_001205 [Alternaria incomplexa]